MASGGSADAVHVDAGDNMAVIFLTELGMSMGDAKKQVYGGKMNLNRYRDKVGDTEVIRLANHCPGLTQIYLDGCTHITDTSVMALAEHCPGLTVIYLSRCTRITDASVMALAEHCPGLTQIGLTYCTHITERATQVLRKRGMLV